MSSDQRDVLPSRGLVRQGNTTRKQGNNMVRPLVLVLCWSVVSSLVIASVLDTFLLPVLHCVLSKTLSIKFEKATNVETKMS